MAREISDELKAEILRLRTAKRLSLRAISRELKVGEGTVRRYWGARPKSKGPARESLPPSKFSESGDTATSEFASRKRIRTVADAIEHGEVDTNVWMVERFEVTAWELGYVRKDGEADSLPLWRVKLYLKRIMPKPLLDAAERIYERLAERAPEWFAVRTTGIGGNPVLASFNLFDVHFGKLGWKPECGKDNDLRITEAAFRSAMAGLVDSVSPHEIARSVIAVGNDYCHFDNLIGTTTSGTPMDTDGRLAKVVEVATTSMIRAVEDLVSRSDFVDVLYVPGNHDRLTSYFICRELAAYFRHCDRVKVDTDPAPRKYVQWERNFLGYTHGDGAKDPKSLPIIMATEKPRQWAQSTCREWHIGHLHTARKFVTRDMDEHCGVRMRWMSALSGSDAWAHSQGFVNNTQAAEVYLYRPGGYHGHFIARPE